MSSTLYLHIGTHKTGSTALQEYLYRHRETLAEHGLVYPDIGQALPGHHELAWACGANQSHTPDEARVAQVGEDLSRLLAGGADVIISSEEFEYLTDMPRLQPLLAAGQVKVVLYVRKQDEMLQSVYNQHVAMYEMRYEGSIYQFSHGKNFQQRFNYHWLASRWAAAVGRDNLIVRAYGTAQVEPDTCADLLGAIGHQEALAHYRAQPAMTENPSQGVHALRLLAHLNRLTLTREQHNRLLPYLRQRWPRDDRFSLLRPEDAEAFYHRYQHSNTRLFNELLGLDHIPFDSGETPAEPTTWVVHEQVDTRELLDLVDVLYATPGDSAE